MLTDLSGSTYRTARGHYLMCPPHHFEVTYSINPWMDPAVWANARRNLADVAKRQWLALHEAMVTRGAKIDVIQAIPKLPDLVFTANAAVVLDQKALLARFRHPQRRGEEPIFASAMRHLARAGDLDAVIELPDHLRLEGTGDCIWDSNRGHFWMGFGPRSDRASQRVVIDVFGVDCVPLELTDPRFYHLDTAFCPLSAGEILLYPNAFTPPARREINDRVERDQQIALQEEDAAAFAANAVLVGQHIILSSCSTRLRGQLEERGYIIVENPLRAFLQAGGSACCLTLRLDCSSEKEIALA